ncbi:type I restriction endonuclease subunit R [Nocardioides humilatus]|uniref:Type I restriction endonuclease subunit R n=1 Tax=Nocardioides humilatus TaxID=2607660 RepID=A0A5B1L3X3_9ACTN|nr:DEAD/DEAH box helicase family protein [Nocardioides humilatus]KAA1415353.1 type I restriction endonuclease subunit R [Nocardioides humilatus]
MSVHTESAFESNIEAYLLANGWDSILPGSYDLRHGLFHNEYFAFLAASQPNEWETLQSYLGGETAARQVIAKTLADQIDRRGAIGVLRGTIKHSGVTLRSAYFKPANKLTPELGEKYAANRLGVVRQLHHSESKPGDSLDLVLVVNGIPVATAELKNPLTHQNVEHAMTQYRTDRNPADYIFRKRTLVHFAVDPHRAYMTTKLAGEQTRFLPFNQGTGGPGQMGGQGNPNAATGYDTAYLWEQVWQRDAWLDLIGSFVHEHDGTILFPRYHQWHAVRSLLAGTYESGAGKDRLIQHSAGSGKSNTIAWTAHALSRLHGADDTPIFDKIVVITDRKVLDRQLQETVAGLEHTPGTIVRIDKNSAQLKDALEGNAARVIITTLQKFPVIADTADAVEGNRFAIIVDEAHSSTSGDAVKDMKKVLSAELDTPEDGVTSSTDLIAESASARGKHANLSFFAFTATPKPKTLNLFGEKAVIDGHEVHRPFHLYSMRQAIEEGFILDVLANYTTYATYFKLATTSPAEGEEDPELPASKAKAQLAKYVSLHPSNIGAKAEIIVEHFRSKTSHKVGGRAKAMVVTRSRLHAVRYFQAIGKYIDDKGYDLRAFVAFSGTVTDPDAPEVTYTETFLNGGVSETQLPKRFAEDDAKVLVVAEKYQTGFDQPLLHTMYVDKKLAGVGAVQTLSRLNRTHPGKDDTFVLDFANTAEEIAEAFRPFYEQTLAEPADPNLLYNLEHDLKAANILDPTEMRAAVDALLSGDDARQPDIYANLAPAVTRFEALDHEEREGFRGKLDSFVRAYAFLAQIAFWTDTDLEELFLYGKALLVELPREPGAAVPLLSSTVQLTHLRNAVTFEGSNSLEAGTDEAGEALPGGGKGKQHEEPVDRLSALVAALNEKFGLDLDDADRVWFEQQKTVVENDDELRTVALHNDRSHFELVLRKRLDDMIVDRHEANGVLFDAYFANPDFRVRLMDFLGDAYDQFREGA